MDYISRKTTKYAGSADRFVLGLWCATVVSSVDCVLISIPIGWLGLTSFMVRIDLDVHLMFDTGLSTYSGSGKATHGLTLKYALFCIVLPPMSLAISLFDRICYLTLIAISHCSGSSGRVVAILRQLYETKPANILLTS
jgi:hypothetical protein